jgi:mono/diheme cytochrome c family protein
VAAVLLGCAATIGNQPLAAESTGFYTSSQAAAGGKLFAVQCVACHGANLEGGAGPQLAGPDFIAKWSGQTAFDVHDIVANQMPQTAPGSLTPDQALALVAYILQQNKYVAGDAPLTAAKLKSIPIAKQ